MPHDTPAETPEEWDVTEVAGALPLHPDCAALRGLVGRWHGYGVVDYSTIDGPYQFQQELVIAHDGRRFLSHATRAWLIDQEGAIRGPAARESGWWRPGADGRGELLLTHPTGIVELFHGIAGEERGWRLRTSAVHCSPTAKEVTAGERHYEPVGDETLHYAENRSMVGQPLHPHVTATLYRAECGTTDAARATHHG